MAGSCAMDWVIAAPMRRMASYNRMDLHLNIVACIQRCSVTINTLIAGSWAVVREGESLMLAQATI
jgi:hypothetical protein